MKYKRIYEEVEVFQFGIDKEPDWFVNGVKSGNIIKGVVINNIKSDEDFDNPKYKECSIVTLSGVYFVKYGDYIIKDPNDKLSSVNEIVFKEKYEVCE